MHSHLLLSDACFFFSLSFPSSVVFGLCRLEGSRPEWFVRSAQDSLAPKRPQHRRLKDAVCPAVFCLGCPCAQIWSPVQLPWLSLRGLPAPCSALRAEAIQTNCSISRSKTYNEDSGSAARKTICCFPKLEIDGWVSPPSANRDSISLLILSFTSLLFFFLLEGGTYVGVSEVRPNSLIPK